MDESLFMNGVDDDIVLKTLTEYNENITLVLGSLANKRRPKLAESGVLKRTDSALTIVQRFKDNRMTS